MKKDRWVEQSFWAFCGILNWCLQVNYAGDRTWQLKRQLPVNKSMQGDTVRGLESKISFSFLQVIMMLSPKSSYKPLSCSEKEDQILLRKLDFVLSMLKKYKYKYVILVWKCHNWVVAIYISSNGTVWTWRDIKIFQFHLKNL